MVSVKAVRWCSMNHASQSSDSGSRYLVCRIGLLSGRSPEYFGVIPASALSPRRYMTRYITLFDGIFALETNTEARLIALAGIIWSLELQDKIPQSGSE